MDYRLSEEQVAIQTMVRKFIQKDVKPGALERDENFNPKLPVEERYPWNLMKKASALGLRTLGVPKRYGGADEDTDLLTQVIIAEELGRGGDAFIDSLVAQTKNCHNLATYMNEAQANEFFPQIMKDDTYLLATAVTEPESSTDIHLPYDEPGVAMKTFAYRDGNKYIINGVKHFITGAAFAKLFLLYARTEKDKPISQAMSGFLVPLGTSGFRIGHIDHMLGRRLMGNAELIFEDCRVPAHYLLMEEGKMFTYRMSGWQITQLTAQACSVGEMQECYELTLEHAKTRVQGGKPIMQHINVGTRLAEMLTWVEAAKALIYKVAWSYDTQYGYNPAMIYLTNAYVKELRLKLVENALDIWAGYGIQIESPIQMYFRHAASIMHGGGLPTINRMKAVKFM